MTLKLNGSTDGSVSIDAPADTSPTGTDITLTLPTTVGSANQFVKNGGTAGELEYSSMVETSDGDIGIGTTSPAHSLTNAGGTTFTTGTAPQYRLNGGAGDSNDNDRAIFGLATASNHFFSDAVAGDAVLRTTNAGNLLFGTGTNEHMRLDSSGRVLIGTTTEGYSGADTLTIAESGNAGITIRTGTSQNGTIAFSDATSGDAEFDGYIQYSQSSREMRLATGSQVRLLSDQDGKLFVKNSFSDSSRNVAIQIECSGQGRGRILSGNSDTDSASFGAGSDRRLKTNIRNYTGGLERIRQIPVKIYDEVNSGVTDVISWVADEVAPIFPEAVIGEANAVDAEGNPEYQILSSLKFFPDLVQCVQTLIDKVETLETQNTAQQAQIDDLLTRVTALEAAE